MDDDPEELSWEARVALQNSSPTLLPSERQPPEPSGAGRATKLRAEADEKMDDEAYDEAARAYELAAQQTEEAAEHAKSWQEAAELRALAENARELAALEALEEEAEAGAAAGGPGPAPAPAADDAGLGRNALFLKMQKRAVAESAAEKAGLDGDDEPDSIRGRPGAVRAGCWAVGPLGGCRLGLKRDSCNRCRAYEFGGSLPRPNVCAPADRLWLRLSACAAQRTSACAPRAAWCRCWRCRPRSVAWSQWS